MGGRLLILNKRPCVSWLPRAVIFHIQKPSPVDCNSMFKFDGNNSDLDAIFITLDS
ncbi:hypothetical protein D5086_014350, partial [Populus alba]